MTMATWKDVTSYAQAEQGKAREARVWEIDVQAGLFRILVHRIHGVPDVWFLSTVPRFFEDRTLAAKGAPEARQEALGLVLDRLSMALAGVIEAAKCG